MIIDDDKSLLSKDQDHEDLKSDMINITLTSAPEQPPCNTTANRFRKLKQITSSQAAMQASSRASKNMHHLARKKLYSQFSRKTPTTQATGLYDVR